MIKNTTEIILDEYEQEIEDSFDQNKSLEPVDKANTVEALKKAAENYLKKDKRITIRVYSSDLERIKRLAVEEGLPYQTYITSILHKVSTGRIKDSHA